METRGCSSYPGGFEEQMDDSLFCWDFLLNLWFQVWAKLGLPGCIVVEFSKFQWCKISEPLTTLGPPKLKTMKTAGFKPPIYG